MTELLNDEVLCRLVLNRDITEIDADIQTELRKNNIFRYKKIPNVQEEKRAYVTFEMSSRKTDKNSIFKGMRLNFFVFSHEDIINTDDGYLRTDLMDERVQYLFNENTDFGIGKMVCVSDDPMSVGIEYQGRSLLFEVSDLSSNLCR
jgi:hypothetical protein